MFLKFIFTFFFSLIISFVCLSRINVENRKKKFLSSTQAHCDFVFVGEIV